MRYNLNDTWMPRYIVWINKKWEYQEQNITQFCTFAFEREIDFRSMISKKKYKYRSIIEYRIKRD